MFGHPDVIKSPGASPWSPRIKLRIRLKENWKDRQQGAISCCGTYRSCRDFFCRFTGQGNGVLNCVWRYMSIRIFFDEERWTDILLHHSMPLKNRFIHVFQSVHSIIYLIFIEDIDSYSNDYSIRIFQYVPIIIEIPIIFNFPYNIVMIIISISIYSNRAFQRFLDQDLVRLVETVCPSLAREKSLRPQLQEMMQATEDLQDLLIFDDVSWFLYHICNI